jgi:pimeloyl-ACP methyl ester carboxylesterase
VSTPRSVDLPDPVRRVRLTGDGVDLAAIVCDPSNTPDEIEAPSILLVHGFTGSKEDFGTLLPLLAAAGYRAVALDLRGQHESDEHDDTFHLEAFAADVVAVARSERGPVHLVGHSFGGLVAADAVLQDPSAFASLTLLCSGPGAIPEQHHAALDAFDEAMAVGAVDAVWEYLRADRLTTDPELDNAVLAFLENRLRSGHPSSHRAIARGLVETPDRTADLAGIDLPVLVAWGEDDDMWPIELQRGTAHALGAEHVEIHGTGHSPAVEDPGVTARALLDWLPSADQHA